VQSQSPMAPLFSSRQSANSGALTKRPIQSH
jgi:hypothetical protein